MKNSDNSLNEFSTNQHLNNNTDSENSSNFGTYTPQTIGSRTNLPNGNTNNPIKILTMSWLDRYIPTNKELKKQPDIKPAPCLFKKSEFNPSFTLDKENISLLKLLFDNHKIKMLFLCIFMVVIPFITKIQTMVINNRGKLVDGDKTDWKDLFTLSNF